MSKINSQENLLTIFIILSTSDLSNDVTTAYENGANLYLKKPRGLLELKYFYKAIDTLGLPIVLFP